MTFIACINCHSVKISTFVFLLNSLVGPSVLLYVSHITLSSGLSENQLNALVYLVRLFEFDELCVLS